MQPQDNISPEEKLLRLIRRGGKKSPEAQKPAEAQKPPKAKEKAKAKKERLFNFKRVNFLRDLAPSTVADRKLLAVIAILGVYLILNLIVIRPRRIEENILMLNAEEDRRFLKLAKAAEQKAPLDDLSSYTQPVESRNLFTAKAAVPGERPSTDFTQRASQLKLQGIISGDNPQAIIEDSRTKEVYFLSPGEQIEEIELKEILPGRVVLDYFGQEVELAL